MPEKPEPQKFIPSLESITVRGKYKIPETDFRAVKAAVLPMLRDWILYTEVGESLEFVDFDRTSIDVQKMTNEWKKYLKETRAGLPVHLSFLVVEHFPDGILLELECRPVMWYRISTLKEVNFTENEVGEALIECKKLVKQLMSVFGGKEVEPVSVYPVIQRSKIKSRLLNLGLKKTASLLDKAEQQIVQNNFTGSLRSSRTAFEKMIDWQMKKRGLKQTNNYRNNLERLKARGHLDEETTNLLQAYYRCLSNIGVHERTIEPGIYEAQMGYGTTLIMLQYFADKLP